MRDPAMNTPLPIAAVILAAGHSVRMGSRDKLLLDIDGESMVRRAAMTVLGAGLDAVVVVQAGRTEVAAALSGLPLRIVENPRSEAGMSSSIGVGIQAIGAAFGAALIILADMPLISAALLTALADAFARANTDDAIVAPRFRGQRGNPVLWGCAHFDALRRLKGDSGARALLENCADRLHFVESPDDAVLVDVDTPQDHERLRSARAS
jgi:molybdenum cofactor cytidylyltransferase